MSDPIYRPKHQQQKRKLNGKLIGCTETSAAMFVDAVTLGGCIVTETIVRHESGEDPPDPKSPGLSIHQIVVALRRLHIVFVDRTHGTRTSLRKALDQDKRVVAQLWYDDIGGGNIGHAVLIQARRIRPGGIPGYEMLVDDPIKGAVGWIDEDDVIRAMEEWGHGHLGLPSGQMAYGDGRVVPRPAP